MTKKLRRCGDREEGTGNEREKKKRGKRRGKSNEVLLCVQ
jgi:hypothetical protein